MVKIVVDEVQRGDRVEVPGEHSKKVELASLDGVETGVRAIFGQTRSVF